VLCTPFVDSDGVRCTPYNWQSTGQPSPSKTGNPAADSYFFVRIGKNFCYKSRFFGPKTAMSKKFLKFSNFVINILGVIIAVHYE
jgi:hypothetical protein